LHSSRSLRYLSTPKFIRKQFGLTLIELLVAISILGLVAVIGWRGLDSIVRTRTALTADLEQTRGMQLAFAQLQNDCAQLANATTLSNRVPLMTGDNRLSLVRTVIADNQPTRLQVISYRVLEGKLTRRESPATRDLIELDKFWLSAVNDTDITPALMLQTGVASMAMRAWMKGGTAWQTNLVGNTAVPIGLEVVLKLQGHDATLIKSFLLGAV